MPETTTGGSALKFYASVRLKTLTQQPSKDVPGAFTGRLKVVKNKCSAPIANEVTYNFVYGKGVDLVTNLIDNAKQLGILRFAGKSTIGTFGGTPRSLWTDGGKKGFAEHLRTNPQLIEELKIECFSSEKTLAGTTEDDLDDLSVSTVEE